RSRAAVELDVAELELSAEADDVAVGEQAAADGLRVHENPVLAAGILDDRADPADDEPGMRPADELAPDADVVRRCPADRDPRFRDRVGRSVRRLEQRER